MKHLYVLMSWPEDMDVLWIKFLSFVSVFCSSNFSCSMIVHIDKTMMGDIDSLNLFVTSVLKCFLLHILNHCVNYIVTFYMYLLISNSLWIMFSKFRNQNSIPSQSGRINCLVLIYKIIEDLIC